MPTDVRTPGDLRPGDIYEDCAYHPCVCVAVGVADEPDVVIGISLVDGTYPRTCSIDHCGVRLLTPSEAWHWRRYGPADVVLASKHRWWDATRPDPQATAE